MEFWWFVRVISFGSVPAGLDVYIHDVPFMFCRCVWYLVPSLSFAPDPCLFLLGIRCRIVLCVHVFVSSVGGHCVMVCGRVRCA